MSALNENGGWTPVHSVRPLMILDTFYINIHVNVLVKMSSVVLRSKIRDTDDIVTVSVKPEEN